MTTQSTPILTDLSVRVRFALRGLHISADTLGRSYSWDTDHGRVLLSLPTTPDDFLLDGEPTPPWIPACDVPDGKNADAIVYLVHVQIDFEGDVSLAEKERVLASGNESSVSNFTRRTQRLWTQAFEAAERATHEWLTHLRVATNQHWLGESIEPPVQHELSEILDRTANQRLMAFGPLQIARVGGSSRAVSRETLTAIEDQLRNGVTPETAEVFLSDARLLTSGYGVLDRRRAVLLAGMACEIRTKMTLRAKVDPDKEPLLDLVLKRASQLQSLLDRPFKAALGVSLQEDDPQLYSLIHQLTDDRNSVVHRGAEIDENRARSLVAAAQRLFAWLDAL